MKSVFISGSISIKKLPNIVCESFDKIIAQNIHIYLGDADGVDILAQNYFASKNYTNITICTIKEYPRNIASNTFKIKQIMDVMTENVKTNNNLTVLSILKKNK